ncbi:hypothetical protein ACVMHR_001808 [Bradyrhizobium diazoefficiens]
MFFRLVAEVPDPDHAPDEADEAEHDEGAAPGQPEDQQRHHGRRHGIAEPGEGMGQALREATAVGRRPVLHRARRGRERRALAEAEREARDEQPGETVDEAGHDGRGRPDHAAPEQRLARAEMITDPAADHLEQEIRIGESGEDEAELGVRQAQLLLDLARRRADVHAIDIGDEIHRAEHREHDMRGLEPNSHPTPPELLLL